MSLKGRDFIASARTEVFLTKPPLIDAPHLTEAKVGKTDAEAEAPILWPPDVKGRLIGKDPDAGKDRGKEVKG